MSKKNKQITNSEKEYYKLNTEATERLATVNKDNARKVSDEELGQYKQSWLSKIPTWVKGYFIKFWFAGAVCFFVYWGLGVYIANQLDMLFVFGTILGFVTNILTNNVLKFISEYDDYTEYIMFPKKDFIYLIWDVLYAFLLLYCTYQFYVLLNTILNSLFNFTLGVEPIVFGIVYTSIDMFFIYLKNQVIGLFKKNK
ncbi:MAG: hypothetical protein Q4D13_01240 [Erysipelotrichaceae bacterium]|nr:hypothetical protein [Erysipelotrichaceae bacterium]